MTSASFRSAALRVFLLAPLISFMKLVLGVVLILVAIFFGLIGSEAGSAFLLSTAREQSNGTLHYREQQGTFLDGLTINNARWHSPEHQLRSDKASVDLNVFPPSLSIDLGITHVALLQSQKNSANTLKPDADKSFTPPRIYSPLPVSAEVNIAEISIETPQKRKLTAEQIALSVELNGSQLKLLPTNLNIDTTSLKLDGEITLSQNFPSKLDAKLQLLTRQAQKQVTSVTAEGPLSQLNVTVDSQGPNTLSASATINARARPLSWDAEISSLQFDLSSFLKTPPLQFAAEFASSGEVGNAGISGQLSMQQTFSSGRVDRYEIPDIDVSWQDKTFSSDKLKVVSPYAWLEGAASFSLAEHFPVSIQAKGEITPPGLYPQGVVATATGNLKQTSIEAAFESAPAGELKVEGLFQLLQRDQPYWEASLNAIDLALHKLVKSVPELTLNASLKSQGWVEEASLSGQVDSQFDGNRHQIPSFEIQWSPQQWALLPTKLYSSYVDSPTDISATFKAGRDIPASLNVTASAPSSKLDIHGELHPNLELIWDSDIQKLETLFPFVSGSLVSSGKLLGNYPSDTYSLQGSWATKQLKVGEQTIGTLEASAAINNQLDQPINLALTAKQIDVSGWQAKTVDMQVDGNLGDHFVDINLSSNALNLKAVIEGKLEKQAQQDWLNSTWRGQIKEWFSVGEGIPVATLNDEATISINAKAASLQHSCWDLGFAQLEPSTSCLEVHWQKSKSLNWQVIGNLQNLPLYWLGARIPDGKVSGLANGEFSANFQWPVIDPDAKLGAMAIARLELMPTTVQRNIGGKPYQLGKFETGSSEIIWDDSSLSATLIFQANNQGWLRLQPTVHTGIGSGLFTLQHQPEKFTANTLSGNAEWYIPELKLLPLLVPQIETINGVSEASFTLNGSIEEPEFIGHINAQADQLTVPDIGLDLEHFEFSATPIHQGVTLSALARPRGGSAESNLRAKGNIFWKPKLHGSLSINGKQFPVLNTIEATIMASPDLNISLTEKDIRYQGKVTVDQAHIAPRVLEGVTKASSDQVFVTEDDDRATSEKWKLFGDVNVVLGEQVSLDASGLKAKLTGQIRVLEEPGRRTRGIGEIQIADGKFEAFGQQLRIDPGRLIFNDADIGDPALDARAIRKLDEITVGATVRGTVSKPEVELFSSPALSQTDALSYLVLGRPLQDESTDDVDEIDKAISAIQLTGAKFLAKNLREKLGIDIFKVEVDDGGRAALVMSKYLSPRFYVSYGLDAFDAKTRLLMRYTLSDAWRLEAESDGKTSSGDLKFTLERD